MKNKKILALAIASTLGLTACGDDSTDLRIDDTITNSLNRQSSIAFDVISSDKKVSTPSFLLMDKKDGTLNIPLEKGEEEGRNNPKVAMGDTDGWSPTQPFVIELDLPTGVTLTTDSELLHKAVKIAKVDVSREKVISNPVALTAGVDYTVISTGTSLAVLPLKGSLEHGNDYIYAITDDLMDSSGQRLGMSANYAALKNKQIDQTGSALEVPQKIVWQVEGLMDGYGFAKYKNIIYSSWFTTSSAGEALYSVKMATASALAGQNLWKDGANPNNSDLSDLYNPMKSGLTSVTLGSLIEKATSQVISTDTEASLDKLMEAHTGVIKLPSFLERNVTDKKWKKTPWQSAMPSLAIISSVLTSGNDAQKAELNRQLSKVGITDLTDPAQQFKLVGQSFTLDGKPLDSERLITKYSPVPQVKSVEKVNFLLITPKVDKDGDPVTYLNKVPVVIYQHGITSLKENILASPLVFATKGYAILAIDLPLHGDRELEDGTVTTATTADVFMNFEYLPVARDNLRQAVADVIGLRAGITMVGGAQQAAQKEGKIIGNTFDLLDTQKVSFFGHSLGAMTGISLQATIDRPLPDSNGDGKDGDGDQFFKIDKAAFANPGGGIPYLLLNSVSFGGTVKHGLMAVEFPEDYATHAAGKCVDDNLDNTACFNTYYDDHPKKQATIDAIFQGFSVAAQTVLETADPFALARKISKDTPVYLAQVKGDSTIPNILDPKAGYAAAYSPIAGTTPLISQLGLVNIYTDNKTSKKVALINKGNHSSAIAVYGANSNQAATLELQSQITSFLASDDGKTATVKDESLIN
jgi:Pla-1/cef family extracellular lipase